MFELFMATLCLDLSPQGIEMDHPVRSKGDNPDILLDFNGKKWGLGCKAPHSLQPKSIFDNIESAVCQINDSKAKAGIPVMTLKNVFNHDECWPLLNEKEYRNGADPIFGAFSSLNYPISSINAFVENLSHAIVSEIGTEAITQLFANGKSEPACLVYCPTATSIVRNALPVSTRLNLFNCMTFGDVSDECLDLLRRLNDLLQVI